MSVAILFISISLRTGVLREESTRIVNTHTETHRHTQGDNHCDIQLLEERLAIEKVKPNRKHGGFRPLLTPHGTYSKSCYKFQICNDLPHLHACKLLVCTRGKLRGKCGNGREAVRRKSVANPLQTNYFATSLHACKLNANTKFASDLHIRKSVDYIKLANGL